MTRPERHMSDASSCPEHGTESTETSSLATGDFPCDPNAGPETSFQSVNRAALQGVSRARFAALLRMSFPGRGDAEVAANAARFLACSDRTVLNWLRLENSPPFDVVFAIGCKVGVFAVMEVMTQGQGRTSVLGMIVKGARRVAGR